MQSGIEKWRIYRVINRSKNTKNTSGALLPTCHRLFLLFKNIDESRSNYFSSRTKLQIE